METKWTLITLFFIPLSEHSLGTGVTSFPLLPGLLDPPQAQPSFDSLQNATTPRRPIDG